MSHAVPCASRSPWEKGEDAKTKKLKPMDPKKSMVSEIISMLETNSYILPPRWRNAETLLLLNEDERQLNAGKTLFSGIKYGEARLIVINKAEYVDPKMQTRRHYD